MAGMSADRPKWHERTKIETELYNKLTFFHHFCCHTLRSCGPRLELEAEGGNYVNFSDFKNLRKKK